MWAFGCGRAGSDAARCYGRGRAVLGRPAGRRSIVIRSVVHTVRPPAVTPPSVGCVLLTATVCCSGWPPPVPLRPPLGTPVSNWSAVDRHWLRSRWHWRVRTGSFPRSCTHFVLRGLALSRSGPRLSDGDCCGWWWGGSAWGHGALRNQPRPAAPACQRRIDRTSLLLLIIPPTFKPLPFTTKTYCGINELIIALEMPPICKEYASFCQVGMGMRWYMENCFLLRQSVVFAA